jgi:glycosyltransferase involved in cell wall biosynthesis
VIPELGAVADDRLALILAALDVAVVPYERYVNSGWTVLALTAGVPVIAPAGSTASEVVRPGALLTFDPAEPGALGRALACAPTLATTAARTEARLSVADLHPSEISERFARLLREVVVDG